MIFSSLRKRTDQAKARAWSVQTDLLRRQDWIGRAKLFVLLLLAVPGIAYGVYVVAVPTGARQVTPGRVAQVHAIWDTQCDVCHVPFQPVRRGTAAELLPAALQEEFDTDATDSKCQSCHAGPPHHTNELASSVPSCGTCHQDHQGTTARLTQVSDAYCLSCHQNLKQHANNGAITFAAAIGGFSPAAGHPKFRSLASGDPGRLKFNHAQHMLPGIPKLERTNSGDAVFGDDPQGTLTLDQLDAAARAQYSAAGEADDAQLVQLRCADCHQLDAASPLVSDPNTVGPEAARNEGRYMLPIRYETHCSACHPLRYDLNEPLREIVRNWNAAIGGDTDGIREIDLQPVRVPHGLQPDVLADFAQGAVAGRLLASDNMQALDHLVAAITTRGDAFGLDELPPGLGLNVPDAAELLGERAVVDRAAADFERLLYGRTYCALCHEITDLAGEPFVFASDARINELQIAPTGVPASWFRHATFDHAAHRALDCRECHPHASPHMMAELETQRNMNPNASVEAGDVLVPDMEVCVRCHAPASTDDRGRTIGGAGHACAECHRYHQGADTGQAWHGDGSSARDAPDEHAIREFLNGG